ncbi:MAG: SO_0444 family Cu/Zn efflux transporter [Muribaculaceae bacterium]|nr:SO_0444 family Cu/Zn efflux transporter [Muribaculaceae bacterium]
MEHFLNSLFTILNEMSPYILLGFILAGALHVFIRPSAMVRHLSGPGMGPVVKAALFGIPLPLCSCGVLPTAVSLRRNGASKGATTSFLIATPQTGVDSIAATYSLLGPVFAVVRPIAALVGSVFGGMAVGSSDRDAVARECQIEDADDERLASMTFGEKIVESLRYGLVDMVASVGKWLVIGLVVAALITVLVPDTLFVSLSRYPILAMLVMILVAIPMYICATGSIPIAMSLMLKGLTPGVAFVLLMAGPAANFASVMILGKTIGRRATAIYVGSVALTAIAFGLLIDYLLPASWFIPSGAVHAACHGAEAAGGFQFFPTLCSGLLLVLLIYAFFTNHHHHHDHSLTTEYMKKEYQIAGMACPHCRATVEKALTRLQGATAVTVDLASGTATVEGDVSPEAVRQAVEAAGFDLK